MKVDWKGVYPAISTQFDDNGQLDLAANERMLNQLIEEGIHGIIALGTVGENCSLSAEEKRAFLRHTLSVARGRIPVIAGCAETTTAFAIDYVRDAETLGVDGIMLLPGMVYRANREETLYHYRTVARATALPIMIYNNPVTYGVDVDLEMTAELAKEANIVAIKESTTDTRRITELHNRFGDRFTVFCGVDDIALESLMLGATGWISGLTNVFPRESVAIYKLARAGRYTDALTLWRWFLPLLRLDTVPHLVQCIKYAEQLAGRGSETVRAPRLPLSGEERARVTRVYDDAMACRPDLSQYNLD